MEVGERRRQDRRHAARVAAGLLVPGLALVLTGHAPLMLYAVFGSFTGMYGRGEPARERLRHQFHGAGMLVTGVALGSLLARTGADPAVLVAVVTAFATIGSLVTDHLRLRPGGPFFGIFALGATALVGPGLVGWWTAVGISAATAALSLLIGLLSGLASGPVRRPVGGPAPVPGRARVLGTSPPARRPAPPAPANHDARRRTPVVAPSAPLVTSASAVHAVRYAVATCLAGATGLVLGLDHANWAMASAAVPLAAVAAGEPLELRAVLDRGLHRVTGTLAGLLVTAAMLLPDLGPVAMAVWVMVLLFPTELFMGRSYGVALGFFTPLILVMTDLASPSPPLPMLYARAADTVIGVLAAVLAAAVIARPAKSGS